MFSCNNGKQAERIAYGMQTSADDSISDPEIDSILTADIMDTSDDIIMPASADELFDDFFFNFVSNEKLQKSRICFPIPTTTADTTYTTSKEEWRNEAFFNEQEYYTLIFDNEEQMEMGKNTEVDSVVVEKLMLQHRATRSYVFDRTEGKWMLRSIKENKISNNANGQFLDFYYKFASQPEFQQKSLCSSVSFITTDPNDDFITVEGVITSESWPAFAPELPKDIIYNIIYSPINPYSKQKIFLLRGISNGLEVELHFIFEQGRWKLARLTT